MVELSATRKTSIADFTSMRNAAYPRPEKVSDRVLRGRAVERAYETRRDGANGARRPGSEGRDAAR